MRRPSRFLSTLAAILLTASACASEPAIIDPPGSPSPEASAVATPPPSEVPFEAAAWPEAGSACGRTGYSGRLGRIEALDARTVRFTLCAPDGAFLARIADPALAILDTATIARLATDPASARSLAGTGPYRIDRWDAGDDVILGAAGPGESPASRTPTVVLRWASDPGQRTYELQAATVDGIDAPGSLDLDRIATLPELAVVPRAGLATAYLAFGDEVAFDDVRVRRAIAGALDREALVRSAFPAGSVVSTHLVPCAVASSCTGKPWYAFNAPAAAAELAATKLNLQATYTLYVPDRPVAGLPDPLAAATAVQAQLKGSLGLETAIDALSVKDFATGLANGKLGGLYLYGIGSSVADPSTFLGPLFGKGVASSPAERATGISAAIADAAATADSGAREAAFGRANDLIHDRVPLIPLAHPGAVVAFRADVRDVVASPLGIDPLGAFTPGDRRQLVFMQAKEPSGAYCGDQRTADAMRLCALVTEPLYGFAAGTLNVEPRLAERCAPNDDATEWTCTLRASVTFHDGTRLDAGDVLASYVAQWDASQPLRAARPTAAFSAWLALFGGSIGTPPVAPSPAP